MLGMVVKFGTGNEPELKPRFATGTRVAGGGVQAVQDFNCAAAGTQQFPGCRINADER